MGCICSKGIEAEEIIEGLKKEPSKSLRLVTSSKDAAAALTYIEADAARINGVALTRPAVNAQENVVPTLLLQYDEVGGNAMVISDGHQRNSIIDIMVNEKNHQSKNSSAESDAGSVSGIFGMPNGFSGEHLAAGWPEWLTSVAPEAVNGWLPRSGDSFEKLNKIGRGTYSNVYKARDLQTGKIVALKKVRFVNLDPESVRFMAREIHILRRLDHPNVVKLEGIVTSRMSCNLYIVFEYMDHDLTGLAATPGIKFTELQVKCYMLQLLRGLEHCHNRGVLHRDIKGANLLMDNNGILRIADFGLATFFNPQQNQTLTSRVVTLWYRPPELLLGTTEYGVAVDLWSCGCILAELLAGKPIMPGRTEVEQLHKIFKLCGSPPEEYWRKSKLPHATIFKPQHPYPRRIAEIFRNSPSSTLALLDTFLAIQPEDRGSATSALQSEFFATKICDPSSLPKYPPSKEYDVKLREEEVMRKRAAAHKEKSSESRRKSPADHKAINGQNANGVLQKRWQGQSNQKSKSEKYSPQEEGGSGFPIDPPRTAQRDLAHPNLTLQPSAFESSWTKKDDMRMVIMCASSTSRIPNGQRLRSQNTYTPQGSGMDFTITRSSICSEYSGPDVSEPTTQKRDAMAGAQEATTGYSGKGKRFQYSGPLMHPGGNMEELLKEHERQIQQAVRKARLDKVKTKKHF